MLLRRRHRQVEPSEVEAPGGSAKKAEWFAYAVHVGVSAEDLEGLTRDQIKDAVAEATAGPEEDPDSEKVAAEAAEAKEKADAEAADALAAAAKLEANGETAPEVTPTEPTE